MPEIAWWPIGGVWKMLCTLARWRPGKSNLKSDMGLCSVNTPAPIQRAKALRLQAERRLGEMLREMPKATGAAGMDLRAVPKQNRPESDVPTLADIGITKKTSMRAQQLAAMPAEKFAMVASGELSVSQATAPAPARETMTERR